MKQPLSNRRNRIEILVHIISWVVIFAFPLLYIDRSNPNFSWFNFLRHSVVTLSFVVAFYLNYFILIPKYLFNQKTRLFILYNLVLVTFLAVFVYIWQGITAPMPNPHELNEIGVRIKKMYGPPKWIFFFRDALGMIFAIIVSTIIKITKRWSESENARREAEKSRTEAELKNLRNQLNPHFLLNTLNNIYALIQFDSNKAQQAVQELSKLLRHMLYDNQQMYIPLAKEADFIYNYIELMRIRLSSNVDLKTNIEIDSHNRTPIAPLLFISLIENAFKHGISPTEPSFINISLSDKNGVIKCEIINSNFPKKEGDKSGSGIGLTQLAQRLELVYPGKYVWEKGTMNDDKEYYSRLTIFVSE